MLHCDRHIGHAISGLVDNESQKNFEQKFVLAHAGNPTKYPIPIRIYCLCSVFAYWSQYIVLYISDATPNSNGGEGNPDISWAMENLSYLQPSQV